MYEKETSYKKSIVRLTNYTFREGIGFRGFTFKWRFIYCAAQSIDAGEYLQSHHST